MHMDNLHNWTRMYVWLVAFCKCLVNYTWTHYYHQAVGVTSHPVPVVFEALILSLVITAASI